MYAGRSRRPYNTNLMLLRAAVMAWSSWNFFATDINETKILDSAKALVATGLAALGYTYVNIDAGSMHQLRDPKTGAIVPDPIKFPRGE